MEAESLVQPLDDANRELLAHVHPEGWQNPAGGGVYDLIVVGAGTAGLVSAVGAAGLGARVALVERALMGGDCLNVGCVPSKGLLRAARLVGEARKGDALGVRMATPEVDFERVMRRMRRRRADISPHDSARRFAGLGIDVYFGDAQFTGPREIAVDGQALRFKRAVIATGARAAAPPIPGLAETSYLTNENLFWLTEQPRRLLVIGGGPIGCEMAQAFARFGSHVTLVDMSPQVLAREDGDAAAIVARALEDDGVTLHLGVRPQQVRQGPDGVTVTFERDGAPSQVVGDRLLVAAGRAPNVETLNLEAANVAYGSRGVEVDDRLRTSNRRIYAAGDVCSAFKFTHAADAMARIVIQNALFHGRKRASALVIPWCTYTDPEIAHVGLYEREAREQGRRVDTLTVLLAEVDRAILDEETDGFVRVHHDRGRLLGCTIVAPHAGEMIGEAAYVITQGGGLAELSATIHPYPTQVEALKKAGDAYRRTLLTPAVRRWFTRYFAWTRSW
ncbi:MAG: mercuric reductase [Vicinamibacterales bacterium]|nr:mercuric reductase [Acidobacteriota bacterium]MDP6372981.1 mercuric reductase [Vicinamibacterales bacterium]MDP6607844.1 mercuric reductase [Vicinamibacterales bacterium]HAK56151.1 FAD-containing oxidoreductase [Acidobacteriota bacterium]|tara:strand:- start:11182 stop:12696 length:1515 start_codon:yes stop_codon:yes gene_type:complete